MDTPPSTTGKAKTAKVRLNVKVGANRAGEPQHLSQARRRQRARLLQNVGDAGLEWEAGHTIRLLHPSVHIQHNLMFERGYDSVGVECIDPAPVDPRSNKEKTMIVCGIIDDSAELKFWIDARGVKYWRNRKGNHAAIRITSVSPERYDIVDVSTGSTVPQTAVAFF